MPTGVRPSSMQRLLLLSACLAALLAGCADDSDAQSHGTASVSYDGNDAGTEDDSVDCDDDATLAGTGSVDEGSIHVTVTDGNGAEQYSETFDGDVDADAERMDGGEGEWTLTVVRTGDALIGGDFDGSYTFTLTC